jgi:hypothetical protein
LAASGTSVPEARTDRQGNLYVDVLNGSFGERVFHVEARPQALVRKDTVDGLGRKLLMGLALPKVKSPNRPD